MTLTDKKISKLHGKCGILFGLLLACVLSASCTTVPITGRQQIALVPSGQLIAMSADEYGKFMSQHEVIRGTREALMVKVVGERISAAVRDYLYGQGRSQLLEGYNWEFNLVKDSGVNAWAMPGGKVAVYTGILPVTKDETGLATVVAHEVAHAIAKHGSERMSQALLTQLGGAALDKALSEKNAETRQLFLGAYGLGAQFGVLLPYSRLQESEADHLGLIFMAMAGYDPREAVDFWQRMSGQREGGSPPEFLSTHPSHGTRIQQIKENLPEALQYYKQDR